jgi:hypothetical protein
MRNVVRVEHHSTQAQAGTSQSVWFIQMNNKATIPRLARPAEHAIGLPLQRINHRRQNPEELTMKEGLNR